MTGRDKTDDEASEFVQRSSLELPDGRKLEWNQPRAEDVERIIEICACDGRDADSLRRCRDMDMKPGGYNGAIPWTIGLLTLEGRIAGYLLVETNAWEGYRTYLLCSSVATWLDPEAAEKVRDRLEFEYLWWDV